MAFELSLPARLVFFKCCGMCLITLCNMEVVHEAMCFAEATFTGVHIIFTSQRTPYVPNALWDLKCFIP